MKFQDFPFQKYLHDTLEQIGFIEPTPIQAKAIPIALEGKDIMAVAQTGTGKTAAFLLPILQTLEKGKGPKALILVPTRELAEQVSKEAIRFSQKSHIKTVCIYGGVPYHFQMRQLNKPYDILVATPGRLIDHLERGKIDLSHVQTLVLDEADRMLDMGFVGPVEKIASLAPDDIQTLMFSATMNKGVQKISLKFQKNPVKIAQEPSQKEQSLIDQQCFWVDNYHHKLRLLESLLVEPSVEQAIVFTSTKIRADQLARGLKEIGLTAAVLHGDIPQRKRTATIKKFRMRNAKFLVATDIAARGLDVPTVSHVINFDLPQVPEDFVHRIGRTGRAGASGTAISFFEHKEKKLHAILEKLTGKKIDARVIEGLEPKSKGEAKPPRKRSGNGKFNQRPNPKRNFQKRKFAKR